MKPETAVYLTQARQCLDDSQKIAAASLFRVAVQEAYLAAFHAAQAVIFEETGKVAKTHSGVRTEFAKYADRYGDEETGATRFLAEGYRWKEVADYDPATAKVNFDQALADRAASDASRVIDAIEKALGGRDDRTNHSA